MSYFGKPSTDAYGHLLGNISLASDNFASGICKCDCDCKCLCVGSCNCHCVCDYMPHTFRSATSVGFCAFGDADSICSYLK